MNGKSLKSQALTRVALVLGILILLNVVSVRIFGRLDVTERGLFTLSEASRNLMRSLDDRVTVKAYFTEDLPAPYNSNRRSLIDQLNEYKAYSGGNLVFEFIDPSGEKAEQEAQQNGVVPVQVQVLKEDKFEVKRAFMGMVFLYEDKKEVIPVIQNTSTLEYDISSTIKRLTTRTRKKLGFLTGQGQPGLNEINTARQVLDKQYEITTVELSGGGTIPDDVGVLIVMAPTQKFSDTDKFKIDQFIMRGGKAAFLLNKVDANLQQRFARTLDLAIEDLLEAYGLRINPDMVRDAQCANVSIMQQQFGFNIQSQVPFPYLPLASNFSRDNMMVKDLQGLVLFFASSLDTVRIAERNLRAEILIRSSAQAGRQSQFFMIDPLARFTLADFAEQHIPLGILVEGQFQSAFTDKPVPVDTAGGAVAPPTPRTISPETRMVLVGDGDFARDQYLGNKDNLTFFANIVDYLMDDAGLITIRSKDVSLPPLEQVSDGTKKMVKYGNLVVPPALVLGYGLLRWRMRKARRKALEMQ